MVTTRGKNRRNKAIARSHHLKDEVRCAKKSNNVGKCCCNTNPVIVASASTSGPNTCFPMFKPMLPPRELLDPPPPEVLLALLKPLSRMA